MERSKYEAALAALQEILLKTKDRLIKEDPKYIGGKKHIPLPPELASHDHSKGPIHKDHPHRQVALDHINNLRRHGWNAEAMRIHENYISGEPGTYTKGSEKTKKSEEILKVAKNGQWSLEKDSANPKYAPKERKIKELQTKIDSGTYKPDAGKIADKIIERANSKNKIAKVSERVNEVEGEDEKIKGTQPSESPNQIQGHERSIK